ncbi:MAG: hypothetical protein LH465_04565 [Sphingomonas bacterium]|nr:hypothetical protein [Sphingomonas bacterium]
MLRSLIAVAVTLSLALGGCSSACKNTIVSKAKSPDGEHIAVLFQRGCGATTGFSTQVSILAPDEATSGGGNTFVADDDHGAAAVGAWGGAWADMRWIAPDHLLIRFAANSRIFEQNGQVSGVKISYRSATP